MRSANRQTGRALGAAVLAAACAFAGSAFAGGPLYLVPSGGTLKPAHWDVTSPVKVYLDKGPLNVGSSCVVDPETYECVLDDNGNPVVPVLDEKAGDDLVASTVYQWSHVPTSNFRAAIAGRSPVDITGANVWDYIGKYNGGGIQTIYDADNSVIMEVTGGDGYGVLGIASPEYTSDQDPTQIIEGWQIIGGSFLNATSTDQISGVVTHEFGHAINLAHTQTNGFYASNNPDAWSSYAGGPEQAGPDQCGPATAGYPQANQIETMYPMIDPWPSSPTYNSPEMAKVLDDADDMAALSSIYPAPGYSAATGTIKGRVVAKDGTSQLTGINVIARRTDKPLDRRVLADLGRRDAGPARRGRQLRHDRPRAGRELRPLHRPAAGRALSARRRPCCLVRRSTGMPAKAATRPRTTPALPRRSALAAGETREVTIAVNGIPRAPTFTHIPYVLPTVVSDNGQQIAGLYAPANESPYWMWDKQSFSKTGWVTYLGGRGVNLALSGNGRVVGGTIAGPEVTTGWGTVVQERAALWTKETGWKTITNDNWPGCDIFHTSIFDLSTDGSTAVGLAFQDCYSPTSTRSSGPRRPA